MTHPDLFGMLHGELTNAEATAAGAHAERCEQCRTDLAQLAVGHALMSRAARTLGQAPATPAAPALPPLAPPRRRSPRPGTLLVAAAAVAAGVAVGAVAGSVGGSVGDDRDPTVAPTPSPSRPPEAYASAELDPVEGSAAGEVEMVAEDPRHTRMTIRTHDLPAPRKGHFYYAWLLDPETNKMLPLGQVGPGGTATFDLDVALLGAYTAVDVSLETDDGDPGHSVTSVLRGSYGSDGTSRS